MKSNQSNVEKIKYHKSCHDCGQFLKRDKWVRKDHLWKYGLCQKCCNKYKESWKKFIEQLNN